MGDRETALDLLWRAGLRVAYRGLRVYWRLFQPRTRGVCVLVWSDGRLLLVRHSYRPGLAIPGGAPRRGETPAQTATRELSEEVGLDVEPRRFEPIGTLESRCEDKRDQLTLLEVDVPRAAALRIDRREIVEARWVRPAELPASGLWSPVPAILALSPRYASATSSSEASPGTPMRSGKP